MHTTRTPREAAQVLSDGCDHVETRDELETRLARGAPLRVKLGIDPTGSDLHLGHAVVLHKLQQFVELGHHVILLIGDFTARIGDPTGLKEERPHLTPEQIEANMRNYVAQAGKVLDIERVEVAYNSTWLARLSLADMIGLLGQITVARMLERNDFANRYAAGSPISLHEFLYPVAQAYDSVALRSDVELGGSEQLFNLLMGRHFQTREKQATQICMTLPILEGTDGVHRMGKSRGNYIGLTEPPEEQFGKVMSIPDAMIVRYARLAAFRPAAECETLARSLETPDATPMLEKKQLAEEIVARYHGASAAISAREHFERTIQQREAPADMPELRVGDAKRVVDVLLLAGFAESKRAAERLVSGGGVRIDGAAVGDGAAAWDVHCPHVLSVGSRRHARIIPNQSSS